MSIRVKKTRTSRIPAVTKAITKQIGRRLWILKGKRSGNQWAKDLGIPQQNISRYLDGSPPHVNFLVHIGRREKVNLNWLILGEGQVFRENQAQK